MGVQAQAVQRKSSRWFEASPVPRTGSAKSGKWVQMQAKPIEPQEIHKTEPVLQAATPPAEVEREVPRRSSSKRWKPLLATSQTYEGRNRSSSGHRRLWETVPEPDDCQRTGGAYRSGCGSGRASPPRHAIRARGRAGSRCCHFGAGGRATGPVEVVVVPTAPTAAVSEPDPSTLRASGVAQAAVARPAPTADYGWLAESLHRRIIELRHYPSTARPERMGRQSLVPKVSIRNDGQLKSVEVVKSSGMNRWIRRRWKPCGEPVPAHEKHERRRPRWSCCILPVITA